MDQTLLTLAVLLENAGAATRAYARKGQPITPATAADVIVEAIRAWRFSLEDSQDAPDPRSALLYAGHLAAFGCFRGRQ